MQVIAGIDIGGTKCALSFARLRQREIVFLEKEKWKTDTENFSVTIKTFIRAIQKYLNKNKDWELAAVGISCGGPLNVQKGVILSPPNLKRWDNVDIYTPLREAFHVPVLMQNDADACALAEWRLGTGRDCKNMIFLTFGTGMGAGLILNGALYSGTTGMAGEIGHIRMEETGPFGYGKNGSFEGFCSGGGIANLGRTLAQKALEAGEPPLFCGSFQELESIDAKKISEAYSQGDALAKQIFDTVGHYLGRGLAILIDVLNPEVIVIGSIYGRQKAALDEKMLQALKQEALPASRKACRIVPASLGERIGDYAAVTVGLMALEAEVFGEGN